MSFSRPISSLGTDGMLVTVDRDSCHALAMRACSIYVLGMGQGSSVTPRISSGKRACVIVKAATGNIAHAPCYAGTGITILNRASQAPPTPQWQAPNVCHTTHYHEVLHLRQRTLTVDESISIIEPCMRILAVLSLMKYTGARTLLT